MVAGLCIELFFAVKSSRYLQPSEFVRKFIQADTVGAPACHVVTRSSPLGVLCRASALILAISAMQCRKGELDPRDLHR